jgi:hypothetical protein
MRDRLLMLVAALAVAAAPGETRAQSQYEANFPVVRHQFLRKDVRQAAYTLMLASAAVRQEVGRCRDEGMGTRLLAMESRLDQLTRQLRADDVSSVATLDDAFAAADRLLAEHHVRLAGWSWATPRAATRTELGRDLGAAAFHFRRALRWEGGTLDETATRAVEDAERLSARLADGASPPKETGAVIDALSRVIVPAQVIAAGGPR